MPFPQCGELTTIHPPTEDFCQVRERNPLPICLVLTYWDLLFFFNCLSQERKSIRDTWEDDVLLWEIQTSRSLSCRASSSESLQHGCVPDSRIHTSQPVHASSIRASPEYHLVLCSFSLFKCFRAVQGTSMFQWSLSVICMHGVHLPSLFPGENKTSVGQPFCSAKRERSTKSQCQLGLLEQSFIHSPPPPFPPPPSLSGALL